MLEIRQEVETRDRVGERTRFCQLLGILGPSRDDAFYSQGETIPIEIFKQETKKEI